MEWVVFKIYGTILFIRVAPVQGGQKHGPIWTNYLIVLIIEFNCLKIELSTSMAFQTFFKYKQQICKSRLPCFL